MALISFGKGDPGVLSFEKVLFSRSSFQALTKQATKGIYIGLFVKGHKMDQGSEEKSSATFVAADHDSSVSEPFSTSNCQDSYPLNQNR